MALLREAAAQGHVGAQWDLSCILAEDEIDYRHDGKAKHDYIDWKRAIALYEEHIASEEHVVALNNLARWFGALLHLLIYNALSGILLFAAIFMVGE